VKCLDSSYSTIYSAGRCGCCKQNPTMPGGVLVCLYPVQYIGLKH
jgi:hypothetical protein